ncbi:MAG: hypothetical protein JWQ71_3417 [Pedosphaera sp.]|nr:hypothetical protein [Pedosphaera sp.]
MKKILFVLAVVISLGVIAGSHIHACGSLETSLNLLSRRAVSPDTNFAIPAIAALRAKGPAGLEALLQTHATLIQQHETNASASDPAWSRLQAALDSVSGQRDCHASHLYWFTDFELAKVAAQAAGKPILSLRLLGKLDEEYSCANSRFFRTTLYANTEVSQYLRDHFILHWKSVRPVPKISIDFGDGRKIERTITGNSIHYVLDSSGQPIDALPGLYGPKAFMKGLSQAEQAALKWATLTGASRDQYLKQYHNERYAAISSELNADLVKLGNTFPASFNTQIAVATTKPTALAASTRAVSKNGAELPMLKSFQKRGSMDNPSQLAGLEDTIWLKIADLHRNDSQLDLGAQKLLRSKNPSASAASLITASKRVVENPFVTALNNLQRSIAEDTVRNEYLLHSQIHQWFASGIAPRNLDQLNSKVYAELFLTPESDPWLGLSPVNTLSGLDNNGLVQNSPQH